jgi:hypothetical protein
LRGLTFRHPIYGLFQVELRFQDEFSRTVG